MAIAERIKTATEHRKPEWSEYIKSMGKEGEYADYYISQQRDQLKLLQDSLIPFKIFDTTSHEYTAIVKEIIDATQK